MASSSPDKGIAPAAPRVWGVGNLAQAQAEWLALGAASRPPLAAGAAVVAPRPETQGGRLIPQVAAPVKAPDVKPAAQPIGTLAASPAWRQWLPYGVAAVIGALAVYVIKVR